MAKNNSIKAAEKLYESKYEVKSKVSSSELDNYEIVDEVTREIDLEQINFNEPKRSKKNATYQNKVKNFDDLIRNKFKNLKQNESILEMENLRITFFSNRRPVNVVRGVNLELRRGEIVGIVGESGSGKSASVRSLIGMNPGSYTTVDRLKVDGVDYKHFYPTSKSLKPNRVSNAKWNNVRGKKIAYIPQDPMTSLNPTRTIKNQILDSIKIHQPDLRTKEERLSYAVYLLETFGIRNARERINSYPHMFSGGMRQRIVIAMMVACSPDVIIADEPTTALDNSVQAAVLELFIKLKNFGISVIFISHNIAIVARLCDRVYVMYAGRVVEQGLKDEVFLDPRHPYTWALISAIPEKTTANRLYTIQGSPPSMDSLPQGDPFALRNPFAMKIDFEKEPDLIKVTNTHAAATWLLHPDAPKVEVPEQVKSNIALFREEVS